MMQLEILMLGGLEPLWTCCNLLAVQWGGLLVEAIKLFSILLTPFLAFALIIHWLERLTQHRLAERFGWKSVMWTGWLGTPIHELSHALMCRVFHHRIKEIALFEPDRKSGRLGFVHHTFEEGNWYQELGNFFIGIAPLFSGSIVLGILLWLFYPEAMAIAFQTMTEGPGEGGPWVRFVDIVAATGRETLKPENLLTARFWLFLYLVLCVGSHMAPSPSDYEGASRGLTLVVGALILICLVLAALGTDSQSMVNGMLVLMGPLFALFVLTIALVAVTAVVVYLATFWIRPRYRLG